MWVVCAPIASRRASHNIPSQLFCIFSNFLFFSGPCENAAAFGRCIWCKYKGNNCFRYKTWISFEIKPAKQKYINQVQLFRAAVYHLQLSLSPKQSFYLNMSCRYQLIFTLHEPPKVGSWKGWRLWGVVARLLFPLWSWGHRVHPSCLCICRVPAWAWPERGGVTCSEAQSDGEWKWSPVSHHFPSGLSWLCSAVRGCCQQRALPAAGHAALVSQGWEFWFCWTKMLFQK